MQRQIIDLGLICQRVVKYHDYLARQIRDKNAQIDMAHAALEVLTAELNTPDVHLDKYAGLNKLLKKYGIIKEWLTILQDLQLNDEEKLARFSAAFYKPHYHRILKLKRHVLDRGQSEGSKLVDELKKIIPATIPQPVRPQLNHAPTDAPQPPSPPNNKEKKKVTFEETPAPATRPSQAQPLPPKTLCEQLIEKPDLYDAAFRENAVTTSNQLLQDLSKEELAKLSGSLRRKLLNHTDSVALLVKHGITENKIQYASDWQGNLAVLIKLVASEHFDNLDFNDITTRQTMQRVLQDATLSPPLALRFLDKKRAEFTSSLNARLANNPDVALQILNSDKITPDQLEQLSAQAIENLGVTLETLSDVALEKLAGIAKFTNAFQGYPALLARLVSLGKPALAANLLSGQHLTWSKEHLTPEQVNALAQADEAQSNIIHTHLPLAMQLSVLIKSKALRALNDGHYNALLSSPLSAAQEQFKEKLKFALQEICLVDDSEYHKYSKEMETLFLNDDLRDVFLANASASFMVKRLLPNEACREKFFTNTMRQKPGLIQSQFSRVVNMLPLEPAYARSIIAIEDIQRSFSADEVTKLLSFNDEVITNYLIKHSDKFITDQHRNNPALIYGNARFAASIISAAVIPPLKFIDLLIDPNQAAFCQTFLSQNNIRDYLMSVKEAAMQHVAQDAVLEKLRGFSSSRKQLIASNKAPLPPLSGLEALRAPLLKFQVGFDTLLEQANQAKSMDSKIELMTRAFLLPDSGKNIKYVEAEKKWKNTSQTQINGASTVARIILGKWIIDSAVKHKLWDFLAIILNEQSEIKTGGTFSKTVVNYRPVLQSYFWEKFYALSFEELLDLLGEPRFKDIEPIPSNKEAKEAQDTKIALHIAKLGLGKTKQYDHCTLVHLRLYPHYLNLIEKRLSPESFFAFLDEVLGKTTNNHEMISDEKGEAILKALVMIANRAAAQKTKSQLPHSVRKMMAHALQENLLPFEALVKEPAHCKLFAGFGAELMPHIKTPEQAALVFHYFPQFQAVFNNQQWVSLRKKVDELPEHLKLTGIFTIEPICSVLKSAMPPAVPMRVSPAAGPGSQDASERYHAAADDFSIDENGQVSFKSPPPPSKPSAEPLAVKASPPPPPPAPKKPAAAANVASPLISQSAAPTAPLQPQRKEQNAAPAPLDLFAQIQAGKKLRPVNTAEVKTPADKPAPIILKPKEKVGSNEPKYPKLPASLSGFRTYGWNEACKQALENKKQLDEAFAKALEEALLAFATTPELTNKASGDLRNDKNIFLKDRAKFASSLKLPIFQKVCAITGTAPDTTDKAIELFCAVRDAALGMLQQRALSSNALLSNATGTFTPPASISEAIKGIINATSSPKDCWSLLKTLSEAADKADQERYANTLKEIETWLTNNENAKDQLARSLLKNRRHLKSDDEDDAKPVDKMADCLKLITETWKRPTPKP